MKLHDRDWYGLVFSDRRKRKASASNLFSFAKNITDVSGLSWVDHAEKVGETRIWRLEVTSARRYFVFVGAEEELEKLLAEGDTPKIVRKHGRLAFVYPCYIAAHASSEPNDITFTFLAPFVGLAREVWLDRILPVRRDEVLFRRSNVSAMYEYMRKNRSNETMRLRLGRAAIEPESDPNLKSLVLCGPNVMESNLYKLLFPDKSDSKNTDKGETQPPRPLANINAHIDDTRAKILYYGGETRPGVIFLDKYGNFRLRPGQGGNRLESFTAFLRQIHSFDALDADVSCPMVRYWSNEDEV